MSFAKKVGEHKDKMTSYKCAPTCRHGNLLREAAQEMDHDDFVERFQETALDFVDVEVLQKMRRDVAMCLEVASVFFLFERLLCCEGEAALLTEENVMTAVFETFNPDVNVVLELWAPGPEFLGKGRKIEDIGKGLFELTKQKHDGDSAGDSFVLRMVEEEGKEDEELDDDPRYRNLPACANDFEFDFIARICGCEVEEEIAELESSEEE
ncbi:hypothetical protein BCR34DRAFT_583776 [Clohesyomyces aquaticus]|uniref:Uncharacterized protein n=1 Tax=Clohesyomyces aquaticus TaxID=1231657 RepID=A0A1Y2A462_9PLEO|nr:hypothetical protein BCR34DRAFT_583776 [Clohesyomyces aquaticus]